MVISPATTNPLLFAPILKHEDIVNGRLQKEILSALKQYAFFYVVDIPGFDPAAEFEMMKTFFDLSQSLKEKYASVKHNASSTNVLRGYGLTRNCEGDPIEEVYNIGQYETRTMTPSEASCRAEYISREPNVWPNSGDFASSKAFKETLQNAFTIRMELARKLVDQIGSCMGYKGLLEKFEEGEFTSFYLKKYSARTRASNQHIYSPESSYSMESEDGRELCVPSHIDTTITLLGIYSNGGLQALYKDTWYDVPPVSNSLLMMSGTLIEELTDNKLPGLQHRVVDIKTERYSTPFFFNPSFHADITTSFSGKATKAGRDYKTFGPWQVVQLHKDEILILNPTSLF